MRGLVVDSSCPFYGHAPEDILQILRGYTSIKDTTKIHEGRANWSCLFGILAWRLWKNRNLFIFQGRSCSPEEIVKVSSSWAKQFFFLHQC
ncbi:hypothetical protein V6Z11_A10G100800 [Gossypium hirsutum]